MIIGDAVWMECPVEEAEQVRQVMRRMMTTAEKLKVPLVADFE